MKRLPVLLFFYILVVTATFLLYFSGLADYGATWDEYFHSGTGRLYLSFLRTHDLTPILESDTVSWLPPLASTIGYLFVDHPSVKALYPFDADRFHIGAILFASLTAGSVFLLAYRLFRHSGFALLAVVLLIFHPQFFAHGHMNVRDMGLMMFFTTTILALSFIGISEWLFWTGMSGILAGCTIASKQSGFALIAIAGIWLLLQGSVLGVKRVAGAFLIFLTFSLTTLILLWPYLWVDTIVHLQSVLAYLRNPGIIGGTTLFFDRVYTSMQDIPPVFPWVMLFLTTPMGMAIAALSGAIGLLFVMRKQRQLLLLPLWIGVPLARFLFPSYSVAYDQIRHFIEVLPVIPLLATTGVWILWKTAPSQGYRTGIIIGVIMLVIHTAGITDRYYPYTTAYFNPFAGSPSYVNHAFEIEFWGTVYREAVEILNDQYGSDVTYYSAGVGAHLLQEDGLKGKLTDDITVPFDYTIFMNKQNFLRKNPYVLWLLANKKPLWTIEREGIVLFYLFAPHKEEYLSL